MVRLSSSCLALLSAILGVTSASIDASGSIRVPKQATARSGVQDQNSAETGFGGGGGGGAGIENSKYFQEIYMLQSGPMQIEFGHVCESPEEWEQRYEKKDFDKNRHQGQHLPEHDKYEFGYRRGNDHHVKERYEKAVPHEGHFKTKVRWADHKGGQGEHYWDYNHAGHGGDDEEGGYSDPVPSYTDSQNANSNHNLRAYQKSEAQRRVYTPDPIVAESQNAPQQQQISKEPQPSRAASSDEGFVKSFQDEIGIIQGFEIQKDGGNAKRTPTVSSKSKEEPKAVLDMMAKAKKAGLDIQKSVTPQLFFDLETGKVVDENTGKTYFLQPIN